MSCSTEKTNGNKPSKSQDESSTNKGPSESQKENNDLSASQDLQQIKANIIALNDKKDSTKQQAKNKTSGTGNSPEVEEKILTNCQVSVPKFSPSNKQKRDETQDGKEEDSRQETKRKSRKCKQSSKANAPRGKGRRFIFKKNVAKTPVASSIPITVESLMYEGQYWQVGDIVSVQDVDGGTYYCQIRGLLQDQYCEKSAALTWLLPTIYSPPQNEQFDPATYIIGQEEEIPRKMECLTFVCHAPSDYYKLKNSPYPTSSNLSNAAHVWATMKPVDVRNKSYSSSRS